MRNILRIFVLPVLIAFVGSAPIDPGATAAQTPVPPKDANVSVKLVGKVWKVVLTGTTTTAIHVVKGQKVVFHAEGSDVYFQFDNDKLFGGHTKMVQSGKTLTLPVGQVAKGTYTYAAFCFGPKVYAVGDSPPKIIVD